MFDNVTLVHGPDGVPLYLEHLPGARSASIRVCMFAGGADGPSEQAGVHHWLEHVVFRGTQFHPKGIVSFDDHLRHAGGLNASTEHTRTVYEVDATQKRWRSAAQLAIELAAAPLLRKKDIESERAIILKEIFEREGNPQWQHHRRVEELILGNHPLARTILGEPEVLKALPSSAVREAHASDYSWRRAVICFSSGAPVEEAADYLSTLITRHRLPQHSERRRSVEYGAVPWQSGYHEETGLAPSSQVHISMQCTDSIVAGIPVALLNNLVVRMLMAGDLFGPLMRIVREERKLVYDINCGHNTHPDDRRLCFDAQTAPGCEQAVIDAIRDTLRDEGTISKARYEWMRDHLLAEQELTPLSPAGSVNEAMVQLQYQNPVPAAEFNAQLMAIPYEAVRARLEQLARDFDAARIIVFTGRS